MHDLAALVLFALVSSGTPGPNNALLWASGLQFGFGATLPQVLGTALGIGTLAVAVAAGLGAVVSAAPEVQAALRVAGSAYLLYLAVQLALGHATGRARLRRPLRVHQALTFQFLNPKAWLFALAAMSAFRPHDWPVAAGSAAVAVLMMAVVLVTASAWAAGGTALNAALADERRGRTVSLVLAAVVAASAVFIWI